MSLDKVTVAKRYSKALFEILDEKGQLDAGFAELEQLRKVFQDNPQLGTALTDSTLDLSKREALVKPFLDNSSSYIHNLIQMVFDYNRMDAMVEIINQFQTLYDEKNQTVYADVTTAVALDDAQLDSLKTGYAERVGAKQVILNSKVDASILGGVIIQSEGTIFDGSIKTKIARVRQALLG
ncbi:F0F1 ATP synthase subunit delta [Secundilactobacillus paracollinoides]|uniref:ATP synthase subunit delta n=1 Tax=Secundilactobacillus paracollinoides TaxID=240427 RepID=A0A1B2IZX7_9LACO|nr:ATP synthase F1 subunit delta [Secundilactobacillus paracollinoides]ANZ61679.1 F0F1 ATP synthase subunit delta [Secundilactobacillus paracollinoides]ANZ63316.1 F0F1 ATP synthase subunit delta [Secundilactobacillus paracollinoides]ANZ67597.1 F0F1 ATP synthase subunit delta [Secundilactobacillus paracollinoides]KRL76008.1 F0F1 ATP synthase subunit delta [Secundilactobacillus paracollinoides DSM 15502 = JCM 11969]